MREVENKKPAVLADVAVIKPDYATKDDISTAKNSIIRWVVTVVVLAQLIPAIPAITRALWGFAK